MAARIVEGIFTCTKRWALEDALASVQKTRTKTARRMHVPMSAIEHVLRILCWLDNRGDPLGHLNDVTASDIARAAHFTGDPEAFVSALIATGWIDKTDDGMRWHDYGSLNRITLRDRQKKRMKRGDRRGDRQGDRRGDQTRDQAGDQSGDRRGASESGDPSEGSPQTRARGAPGGAPAARSAGAAPDLRTLDDPDACLPVLRKTRRQEPA